MTRERLVCENGHDVDVEVDGDTVTAVKLFGGYCGTNGVAMCPRCWGEILLEQEGAKTP